MRIVPTLKCFATVFLACFLSLVYAHAQQMPHYSLFTKNLYSFNPAYAGMDLKLNATGIYRSQWNKIEGQPERYHFNAHLPVFAWFGGAGMLLETEQIGPRKWTQIAFSYNYVLSTDIGVFSFGVRPGFRSWSWDGTQLITPGGNIENGNVNLEDPILRAQELGASQFNIDLGIHYQGRKISGGVFAQQVLPSTARLADDLGYESNLEYGVYSIYSFQGPYEINFRPAALVMSDGIQTQSTINIGGVLNSAYYLSLGLRGYSALSLDAFTLGGGIKLNDNFWAYYNVDLGLSALKNAHSGTQEIIFTYMFLGNIGAIVPPRVIYNPRYR